MFNSQMKSYVIYKDTITTNEYKEKIKTPVLYKNINMFISINTFNPYLANNLNLTEFTHKAVTEDKTLEKGMTVDNRYTIEFVNNEGKYSIVYLKELV